MKRIAAEISCACDRKRRSKAGAAGREAEIDAITRAQPGAGGHARHVGRSERIAEQAPAAAAPLAPNAAPTTSPSPARGRRISRATVPAMPCPSKRPWSNSASERYATVPRRTTTPHTPAPRTPAGKMRICRGGSSALPHVSWPRECRATQVTSSLLYKYSSWPGLSGHTWTHLICCRGVARIKRAMTIFLERMKRCHLGGPHSRAMTSLVGSVLQSRRAHHPPRLPAKPHERRRGIHRPRPRTQERRELRPGDVAMERRERRMMLHHVGAPSCARSRRRSG